MEKVTVLLESISLRQLLTDCPLSLCIHTLNKKNENITYSLSCNFLLLNILFACLHDKDTSCVMIACPEFNYLGGHMTSPRLRARHTVLHALSCYSWVPSKIIFLGPFRGVGRPLPSFPCWVLLVNLKNSTSHSSLLVAFRGYRLETGLRPILIYGK